MSCKLPVFQTGTAGFAYTLGLSTLERSSSLYADFCWFFFLFQLYQWWVTIGTAYSAASWLTTTLLEELFFRFFPFGGGGATRLGMTFGLDLEVGGTCGTSTGRMVSEVAVFELLWFGVDRGLPGVVNVCTDHIGSSAQWESPSI